MFEPHSFPLNKKYGKQLLPDNGKFILSVPRAPACVWCYQMNGMVLFFQFCRIQLAYLSLARLLARLETSQECLVHALTSPERQTKTFGPSVALDLTVSCAFP